VTEGSKGRADMAQIYSGHKLCNELKLTDICLVVERYQAGAYTREFHHHVRKSRLSKDALLELLRALALHFGAINPHDLVRCYLNSKTQTPPPDHRFAVKMDYPEPGVLRQYRGKNVIAWSDQVILPGKFRRGRPAATDH
jgi:hypothetical protein